MGRLDISDELYSRCKVFLESLRRSGKCNMFGAVPYLMEEFDIRRVAAEVILKQWMQTYNADDYVNIDFNAYRFKTLDKI